jgi:hypothetical protein
MATYTVRTHHELDKIAEYDKDKLVEAIQQYNQWYSRHVNKDDRNHGGQYLWSYATYDIKDYLHENMVEELTTLEETKGSVGEGSYPVYPVGELLHAIDTIRRALLEKKVHPTLSKMQPALLMEILNKLELCTRRVIQNTSIRRLHQKSWAHADSLAGNHGGHSRTLDRSEGKLESWMISKAKISSVKRSRMQRE